MVFVHGYDLRLQNNKCPDRSKAIHDRPTAQRNDDGPTYLPNEQKDITIIIQLRIQENIIINVTFLGHFFHYFFINYACASQSLNENFSAEVRRKVGQLACQSASQ